MIVEFVRTHKDAILPAKNDDNKITGDSGYDLFAVEDIFVPAGGSVIAKVGMKLGYITEGYWFRIEPRSGLGFKSGIQPHLGVIDNGYRGDLGIKLYNFSNKPCHISKGNGVAQFIVYEMVRSSVMWRDEVSEGSRGEKGFGSSDKKS